MHFSLLWNVIKDTYIFILLIWLLVAILARTHRHYKIYLVISTVVYVAVLLYVTLLGRTGSSEYQMELSFLWEYRLALKGNFRWWMQIFDNIMLFVPMGWLYGALQRKSTWWKAAVLGLCASLFVESCQLVFKLGLFELDDILNNTIGMMVGYGIYRYIQHKARNIMQACDGRVNIRTDGNIQEDHKKHKTLFLIGNGFDSAHNLPTAYSCFRNFLCEQYNVDEDSVALVPEARMQRDGGEQYDEDEIASYIVQVIDMVAGWNWGDLETCLGYQLYREISFDLKSINMEDNDSEMWSDAEVNGQISAGLRYTFEEMKRQFCKWVKERLAVIDYDFAANNPDTKDIRNTIGELFAQKKMDETLYLCFNYTYTLQKLYGVSDDAVCQIHGTVDDCEDSILFGHGDESDIADQMIDEVGAEYELGALKRYLKKDTDQAIAGHADFFDKLADVQEIYSYGFSFSDADMLYLDEIEKHVIPKDVTWYLNKWDTVHNPQFKKLLMKRGYRVEQAAW